jgi:hypothetical protein
VIAVQPAALAAALRLRRRRRRLGWPEETTHGPINGTDIDPPCSIDRPRRACQAYHKDSGADLWCWTMST